ncbi:MAG: KEOPS complex subunit Pcc1 [Thermoplasmatota archaeon]
MKARARIDIDCGTRERARAIAAALAPEDAGFVTTVVQDAALHAEAEADSIGALLHTLDDYLACLTAALGASVHK